MYYFFEVYAGSITSRPGRIEIPENTPAAAVLDKFYSMIRSAKYNTVVFRVQYSAAEAGIPFEGLLAEYWSSDNNIFWYWNYDSVKDFSEKIGYDVAAEQKARECAKYRRQRATA